MILTPEFTRIRSRRQASDIIRSDAFKSWFGDWENDPEGSSKILSDNGEPLVVYHGTQAKFDTFDPARGKEYGIYTTPKRNYASMYGGGQTRGLYLNIRNPLIVESKGEISPRDITKEDIDKLISQGYDGIVSMSSSQQIWTAHEIIAFHGSQVKNAR